MALDAHYSTTPSLHLAFALPQRWLNLRLVHQRRADLFAQLHEFDFPHRRESSARRNEVTHDDVLLEATETIDFAQRRRFGEHTRGILERGRRDAAIAFSRFASRSGQAGSFSIS